MAEVTVLIDDAELQAETVRDILAGSVGDSVEVVISDPGFMRVLNNRFRHIDRPTDVLSFDLAESEESRPEGTIYVDGRLFPPMNELLERIYHGYLHLCGYTHDTPEESESMAMEVGILVRAAMERIR